MREAEMLLEEIAGILEDAGFQGGIWVDYSNESTEEEPEILLTFNISFFPTPHGFPIDEEIQYMWESAQTRGRQLPNLKSVNTNGSNIIILKLEEKNK